MKIAVAWLATGMIGLLAVVGATVAVPGIGQVARIGFILGWSAYGVVGLLIVLRRPSHPIGWIFLALPLASHAGVVGQTLSLAPGIDSAHLQILALSLIGNLWVLAFVLVARLLAVFPSGRLPSRRWLPLTILSAVVVGVGLPTAGSDPGRIPLSLLLGGPAAAADLNELGQSVSGLGLLLLFVGSASAMGLRVARSRGVERQQLKWFAYAAFLLVATFVATAIAFFTPELRVLDPEASVPPAMFGGVPFILALVAIPIAAGIAILRHRLYDIDLLINRTLVYGVLTVTLGVIYAGSVIVLQGVLSGLAGGGGLAVAAATLAVAALFQPMRRRIQRAVDRHFYRSRYDAQRTLEAFSTRLGDEIDLSSLTDELRATVVSTLQPVAVSVWLREPGRRA